MSDGTLISRIHLPTLKLSEKASNVFTKIDTIFNYFQNENINIRIIDKMKVLIKKNGQDNDLLCKIIDCESEKEAKLLVFILRSSLALNKNLKESQFRFITQIFGANLDDTEHSFGKVYLVENQGNVFIMRSLEKSLLITADYKYEIPSSLILPKHPYIAGIHSSFETEEKLFILSQYPMNGDICNYLSDNLNDHNLLKRNIAQIVSAIHFCHSHSLHFKDLTPENILISNDVAMITEFFSLTPPQNSDLISKNSSTSGCSDKSFARASDWMVIGQIITQVLSFSNNYMELAFLTASEFGSKVSLSSTNSINEDGNHSQSVPSSFLSFNLQSSLLLSLIDQILFDNKWREEEQKLEIIKTHRFFKGIKWIPCTLGKNGSFVKGESQFPVPFKVAFDSLNHTKNNNILP